MLSDFGKKIEILQAERALPNAKLARKLGIFPQNIAQLKRVKKPRIKTVYKLSQALNAPVSYLLGYD